MSLPVVALALQGCASLLFPWEELPCEGDLDFVDVDSVEVSVAEVVDDVCTVVAPTQARWDRATGGEEAPPVLTVEGARLASVAMGSRQGRRLRFETGDFTRVDVVFGAPVLSAGFEGRMTLEVVAVEQLLGGDLDLVLDLDLPEAVFQAWGSDWSTESEITVDEPSVVRLDGAEGAKVKGSPALAALVVCGGSVVLDVSAGEWHLFGTGTVDVRGAGEVVLHESSVCAEEELASPCLGVDSCVAREAPEIDNSDPAAMYVTLGPTWPVGPWEIGFLTDPSAVGPVGEECRAGGADEPGVGSDICHTIRRWPEPTRIARSPGPPTDGWTAVGAGVEIRGGVIRRPGRPADCWSWGVGYPLCQPLTDR